MLGSNLIGFQTYSYSRHFISSCTRVLGLESTPKGVDYKGSQIVVGIFPIGIDVGHIEALQKNKAVQDKITAIRDLYHDKYIIIGRDKLDHINGIQHKLNAFEKFLTMYPEWRDKVVLIQVTSPAQRENPKLESKVSEIVGRINGTFGSLEFQPVHHYHHHLEQDEYLALLTVAHVGLITSIRDGMNTTSHEFAVCQGSGVGDEKGNWGPLILSEFTGTAGSLSAAMLVNPWDYLVSIFYLFIYFTFVLMMVFYSLFSSLTNL
jgi:trehalose 6-phosphate synthase/phosphatase